MKVDDVIAKVIAAMGGEANLRKHKTILTKADINFSSEGVTGTLTASAKAPFCAARRTEFRALDRPLGSIEEIYDGTRGCVRGSFISPRPMSKAAAGEARIESAFYGPLEWKNLYKSITISGTERVNDEECLVLEQKPQSGASTKAYVSTKSWLILRRDISKSAEAGVGATVSEYYSDFRKVDGVMVPFAIKQKTESQGESETRITIKDVKFDADVADDVFRVTEVQ
jgi:Outer membrane lipoprotein-sorting protein